jgi:threonine aldolase
VTIVDLRSDTVTRPTPTMRKTMAEAEVGDDVYGEDPTVNALQDRAAALLGHQAALFVPSGTMANQIAIGVLTRPGDEVVVGARAHNWLFETGAAAAINGVQHCVLPGDGRFDGAALRAAYKPDDHHHAATTVVALENTHNMAGGLVWDHGAMTEVLSAADELGMTKHLDGARLWNAAVATGRSPAELCRGFDTVAVCLSKGLGAPVGSLVVGNKERIHQAHRLRKMLGGGMRQAGILAAAGLHALDHHVERLADDHRRAREIGSMLAALEGLSVDPESIQSNIVMAEVDGKRMGAAELVQRAGDQGVLFYDVGPARVRLVTHLDIGDDDIGRAADVIAEVLRR